MLSESPRLPTYTLSSRALGGAAALREFDEATIGAFTAIPDLVSSEDFRIHLQARNLGSLVMTETVMGPARFERSKRMIARTGTDHIYLVRYGVGGATGTVEGRDFHVRTGDICLLDLTRPRASRSDTFRNATLVIPRALLADRGCDIDALHGLVLPRELPLTAMLSAHLDTLFALAPELTLAEGEIMAQATASMVGALLARYRGGPRAAVPQRRRAEVMRYIGANLSDPMLSPSQMAQALGMSRAALYRMFEEDGGVAEVIREKRLAEAAVVLAGSEGRSLRISEVARRMGFVDNSSFSRAFRAHFGVSPREARDQAVTGAVSTTDTTDRAALAAWLRRLAR